MRDDRLSGVENTPYVEQDVPFDFRFIFAYILVELQGCTFLCCLCTSLLVQIHLLDLQPSATCIRQYAQ